MNTSLLLATVSLLLATAASASPLPSAHSVSQALAPACFATFASGEGEGAFSTCISADGNLQSFRIGLNEHISTTNPIEGYALCSNGGGNTYYDAASAGESGWRLARAIQPNGANTLPLSIVRTSSDGAFRLTQTYYVTGGRQTVLVSMDVQNLTALDIPGVTLARMVNADVDGSPTLDSAHTSRRGVTFWNSPNFVDRLPAGLLQLSNLVVALPTRHSLGTLAEATANPGCAPYVSLASPVTGVDMAGKLSVDLGRVQAGATRRVNFMYTGH